MNADEPARIGGYDVHPLAAVFPEASDRELEALTESIRASGLLTPILRVGGVILAGRGRLRACLAAGVEPRFRDLAEDADPLLARLAAKLDRTHLTRSQRAMAAARVATLPQGGQAKGQPCTFTVDEAAKRFEVSARLVKSGRAVLRRQCPALTRSAERDVVSVSRAELLAALPNERLDRLLRDVEQAASASERNALVREALVEAGLINELPGDGETRRMKESVEVLAAHVRDAETPRQALDELVKALAAQAGVKVEAELVLLPRPEPVAAERAPDSPRDAEPAAS